jgi:DNA-binding response OmpR family regulator
MPNDKKTILLAEDEEDLREMYTLAFSNGGYEVLSAINGKETMEWLEKEYARIDAILLDIVMPVLNGSEVLEKIKKDERFKDIPVIIFTNLDNDEDKQQMFKMGANDYFVKSKYTPSELVEKIGLIFSKSERILEKETG